MEGERAALVDHGRGEEVGRAGVSSIAVNCPGCYITMGFTSVLFGKRLRYMPDEILRAFGDHISHPLGTRMPLIAAIFARRLPGLLLARGRTELPPIQAGTPRDRVTTGQFVMRPAPETRGIRQSAAEDSPSAEAAD